MIIPVVETLQALHTTLPGVKSAPTVYPGSLKAAELPTVLITPGEATHTAGRVGVAHTSREFRVHVFCAPVAQGKDGEGLQTVAELLPYFIALYVSHRSLAPDVVVDGIRDSGHTVLNYAGYDYHGFIVFLSITTPIH